MAKFYGRIGYAVTSATRPGIWEETINERDCYGDIMSNKRRYETSSNVNDNVTISNSISIIADPYAMEHLHNMKYVRFMGGTWKINDVEVQYPRLIINLGGVYNA